MYTGDQIRRVLVSSGVSIMGEVPNNFMVFCPYHHNARTPAGEISHDTGMFFCFSCKKVAELPDFLNQASGIKYFQALRLISKYQVEKPLDEDIDAMLNPEPHFKEFDRKLIDRLHTSAMTSERAIAYYAKRGVSQESIEKYHLGYSEHQDMIIMPFMSPTGDMYIGFDARSIEGKKFMAQGDKSKTLFNIQRHVWSENVFLTESILDAIRVEQCGASAIASMGSNHSKNQVALLTRYFNTVYVVQDIDDASNSFAGQVSAKKLVDKLGKRGIIVSPPDGYKDIGNMPDEQIKTLVANTIDPMKGIEWD